jgi:MFS family permease
MGFFGMSTNLAMSVAPAAGVAIAQYTGYGILFLIGAIIALFAMASSYLIHEDPLKKPAAPPAKGWRNFLLPSAFFPATLALLGSLSYASVVAFLPLFAHQKGIGNPGLFFSVFAIILLLTRGPLGRLSDRWGRATTIIPGFFLTASSLMLLALFPAFWAMMAAAILNGLGTAASQPSLMALAVDRCGPNERGAAMGTFSTAFDLGIGTGSFAWGIIVQTAGFSVMYFASSSVCLLAALVTFWGISDRTNPSQ